MRSRTRIAGLLVLVLGAATAGTFARNADHGHPGVVRAGASTAQRITYPPSRHVTLVLPGGQTRAVYSMLNVRRPMQFGDYLWDEDGVPAGPAWVRVDLARQTLSVFRAGHEIGTTVILFGATYKPTPAGVFPVLAKALIHRSTLYDAEMPFMLRLTGDGVAIHASHVHKGAATHGCIGVPPAFARLLYGQMHVGDQVAIIAA